MTLRYLDPISPSGSTFNMVIIVLFYVILLVVCGANLVKIKKKGIEMKANSDSCKTNIQSIIFTTLTITILISIAFIIDLQLIIKKKITGSRDFVYVGISKLVSLFYEGITGLVVTFSLLAWFPQLRPTIIQSPLQALPAGSKALPAGSQVLPAGSKTLPASEALPAPSNV